MSKECVDALFGLLDFFHEFDFNFMLHNLRTPEEEVDFWKHAVPLQTIEERYSDTERFGNWLPKILRGAPDEVVKLDDIVRKMNVAIETKDRNAYMTLREQGRAILESVRQVLWGE